VTPAGLGRSVLIGYHQTGNPGPPGGSESGSVSGGRTLGTATYKLAKYIGGRSHYAELTTSAEFGGGHSVQVSPAAFGWLKDEYGPNAWEWEVCEAYRAAAVSGAVFALRHIAGRDGMADATVVVDRIHAHPDHSPPDDVAYAAVFAVWKALGVEGGVLPEPPGSTKTASNSGLRDA
jgi:hypothetical protein